MMYSTATVSGSAPSVKRAPDPCVGQTLAGCVLHANCGWMSSLFRHRSRRAPALTQTVLHHVTALPGSRHCTRFDAHSPRQNAHRTCPQSSVVPFLPPCPASPGCTCTSVSADLSLSSHESDNDIVVVKEWLGHADLRTTSQYLEVSIERKRAALAKVPPPKSGAPVEVSQWKQPALMAFLTNLSRGVMLRKTA